MSIKDNFPSLGPSLSLNFARSKTLDPRITFSRTNPTATYMNENGLIVTAAADEPRFDHKYENGVVKSLGLLVEEQRVNKLQYGETFNTAWNHIGFTSNAVDSTYINPTGGTGAKKLIEESGTNSGQKVLYRDITVSSNNAVYTHSCFVKPIGSRNVHINIHNTGSPTRNLTVNFNLSDGTVYDTSGTTSVDVSLDDYGIIPYPNGWYRIYVTGNTSSVNSSGTALRFHIRILNGSYTSSYTGDGSSGLYVYGGQMELGAFPTSLIKNSTNSDVTRSADNVTMTGTNFSDWYNQEQGTMVWIGNVYSKELSPVQPFRINRTNGGNLRGMAIQFDTRSANNTVNFMSRTQSSNIPSKVGPTGVIPSDNKIKIAGGYIESVGLSTLRAAFNGLPAASYSGASQTDVVDGAMNELEIMYNRGTSGSNIQFTGVCEQLVYYPKIFTDTQLQNLTK